MVNIASYAAYFAFPQIAAYTSSKGALVQLTRKLALEAIKNGIRVNAIGVGDVVTNIWRGQMDDGQAFLADHGRKAPIGRAAKKTRSSSGLLFALPTALPWTTGLSSPSAMARSRSSCRAPIFARCTTNPPERPNSSPITTERATRVQSARLVGGLPNGAATLVACVVEQFIFKRAPTEADAPVIGETQKAEAPDREIPPGLQECGLPWSPLF